MAQSITGTLSPIEEKHVTAVKIFDDRDYVAVAGSSKPDPSHTEKWYNKTRNTIKDTFGLPFSEGEIAQFINQGIRKLRAYKTEISNAKRQKKDRSYLLVFKECYKPKVFETAQKIATYWGAEFKVLDSNTELVNFINGREAEQHRIQQLDVFSHGVVGTIEFGYDTEKRNSYAFSAEQVKLLKRTMFYGDAIITSYACRTGIGSDKKEFNHGDDPKFKLSLAQKMVDHLGVTVYAYARRSDYQDTYGTDKDRKIANDEKLQAKVKEYDRKVEEYRKQKNRYQQQLNDYQKELETYRASGVDKKNATELPGKKAPVPPQRPKKDFSDEHGDLARHEMSRKENADKCDIPLDRYGAVRNVKAGETPKAPESVLPFALIEFKPFVGPLPPNPK